MAAQDAIPGMENLAKPQNDSNALMKIIDRTAFNPTFDPIKLTALYDLYKQTQKNESRLRFLDALQTFKKNVPTILKTKQIIIPMNNKKKISYSRYGYHTTQAIVRSHQKVLLIPRPPFSQALTANR